MRYELSSPAVWLGVELQPYNGAERGYELSSATVWMEVELQAYNGALWEYELSSATVWMEVELHPYNGALWGSGELSSATNGVARCRKLALALTNGVSRYRQGRSQA